MKIVQKVSNTDKSISNLLNRAICFIFGHRIKKMKCLLSWHQKIEDGNWHRNNTIKEANKCSRCNHIPETDIEMDIEINTSIADTKLVEDPHLIKALKDYKSIS